MKTECELCWKRPDTGFTEEKWVKPKERHIFKGSLLSIKESLCNRCVRFFLEPIGKSQKGLQTKIETIAAKTVTTKNSESAQADKEQELTSTLYITQSPKVGPSEKFKTPISGYTCDTNEQSNEPSSPVSNPAIGKRKYLFTGELLAPGRLKKRSLIPAVKHTCIRDLNGLTDTTVKKVSYSTTMVARNLKLRTCLNSLTGTQCECRTKEDTFNGYLKQSTSLLTEIQKTGTQMHTKNMSPRSGGGSTK